eukprot:CAMPEP_0181238096 /NCGR_PEP_ID=MMETSP1096-20121128/39146_1 /TAXON_ID=156174 ORGANISM="Chrysochromulina ericina, Strain CCMP281" /NCGR_SAMPLE_ID=MMETSP1096 /ASSEMBLY_ACC=CAM_ASM_000453 /LENGTH=81 /DNA_ID=CAMNT_0023333559 /DNA_START=73 /DNA_END=319 /DNA_ORIENTATION=-
MMGANARRGQEALQVALTPQRTRVKGKSAAGRVGARWQGASKHGATQRAVGDGRKRKVWQAPAEIGTRELDYRELMANQVE